ncbi:hypothetical protein [Desulfocicer vacuolatum]|nr:hypothetical protein [Desulfocicer vacuolatum]
MKYSSDLWSISIFVVGKSGSTCGLPVAVIMKAAYDSSCVL